jgi:hypothetical protein
MSPTLPADDPEKIVFDRASGNIDTSMHTICFWSEADKLLPYTGSDSWAERTLHELKACLESNSLPRPSHDCEYCGYASERARTDLHSRHDRAAAEKKRLSAPS